MKKIFYIGFVCLIGMACKPQNTPTESHYETTLDKGKAVFFGAYYTEEGIETNVMDLDLLSQKLHYDTLGHIVGTGTNVYLSDIFLPSSDSILAEGIYTCNTTATPHTFLPGMEYEGNYSGAYLLRLTDNQLTSIQLIESGSFTLSQKGDTTEIVFDVVTQKKQAYKGEFRGVLPIEKKKK